jgi:hypothetical protein
MDEMSQANAFTRIGLECLTLWMESDRLDAADHIARLREEPNGPQPEGIMVGLLSLADILVVKLAKERGATTIEDLATGVHEILRDLSQHLPRIEGPASQV